MENNEILGQFHELNYREHVELTLRQDHFRNAEIAPLAQQMNEAVAKAALGAQKAICKYEIFQGTAICSKRDI